MQRSKNSAGSSEEREQMIRDIMESSGVPREEAEFIAALELGETSGDLINMDEEQPDEPAK